jgi:hypothetical protein
MALEIGADLAATILGLGVAHVRQLAKVRLRSAGLKANGDGGPDPRPSHP